MAEFGGEPGFAEAELAADSFGGDAAKGGDFLEGHAAEVAELEE